MEGGPKNPKKYVKRQQEEQREREREREHAARSVHLAYDERMKSIASNVEDKTKTPKESEQKTSDKYKNISQKRRQQ